MNSEWAGAVIWRRLLYSLTPQWDIYSNLHKATRGRTVLEVGFGTGAGVLQYYSNTKHVDAIDPDGDAVTFARRAFPIKGINWIEADITSFDHGKEYDVVIMIETLEHIASWERALENIKSILAPQGALIMSARNANADLRRFKELHHREWTAEELSGSLKKFFPRVDLYDYTLENEQDTETRLTPLVAFAKKQESRKLLWF